MQELTDDGGSGDAQVDEAVRTLEALEGLPVHGHASVIERVHQVLQERLSGEPDAVADDDFGDDDRGDDEHGAVGSPNDAAEPGVRATPDGPSAAGRSPVPGGGVPASGGSSAQGAEATPGGWPVPGGASVPGGPSTPGGATGNPGSGDGEG